MFKKNINNAEKLLMQFKCQVSNDLDPKRKHMIMKLCNDEGAYLNYKKGKIDFGIEKPKPKFQEKRDNRINFFNRRKKQSLEHPGDMIVDFDEVVDRLYSPKRELINAKKKSWFNDEERASLMNEVKIAQQFRNLEVLKKLQKHKEGREKLHEQIEAYNQNNGTNIQFSKEGISNIQFGQVENLLEEALNRLNEQGLTNKSALSKYQRDNQNNQQEDSDSRFDMDYDDENSSQKSEEQVKEKRTLEQFRHQLQERKRLKKIEEYKKKKTQKSMEQSPNILQNKISPHIRKNNQDLLIEDKSPKNEETLNNKKVLTDQLIFTNIQPLNKNNKQLNPSRKLSQNQSLEDDSSSKIQIKSELKQKYKVPVSQMIKHPNYYIWGDPLIKEQRPNTHSTLMQNSHNIVQKSQRAISNIPTQKCQSLNISQRLNQKGSLAQLRQQHNDSQLSSNSHIYLMKPTTPQFITEPFNFKFKPSTPRFPHPRKNINNMNNHSQEISLFQNPRGRVTYGLESSQQIFTPSNQNISPSKSQQLQTDLTKVKQFIQECLRNESDEGERRLEKQLIFEDIRHDRMKEISQFLEQHNYVSANQLALFLKKRNSEIYAMREDVKDSIIDYKLGIMDPSREAAGIEKQQNIKKNLGKKLRYNKIHYKM